MKYAVKKLDGTKFRSHEVSDLRSVFLWGVILTLITSRKNPLKLLLQILPIFWKLLCVFLNLEGGYLTSKGWERKSAHWPFWRQIFFYSEKKCFWNTETLSIWKYIVHVPVDEELSMYR
jgi:hypothetical protein